MQQCRRRARWDQEIRPLFGPIISIYFIPAAVLRLPPSSERVLQFAICNQISCRCFSSKIERLTRVSKVVYRQDATYSDVPRNNCLFMQWKSLLNGIPKFVLKIGQNLNFKAFHLGVKVSEICHKLFETSLI